jgi:NTE family protein
MSGGARWRKAERTRLYDHTQIRQRLDKLRHYRAKNDNAGLLFTLNEGVHGNMGGMGKVALYCRSKLGTKHLIEDYVAEIADSLQHIASLSDRKVSFEEKYDFFHRASLCYGRSALMLSGGGSLGHFHIGVIKALMEQDLVPTVLSGASAGSMVSAIYGTRTPAQMQEFLKPENLVSHAKEEAGWFNRIIFGEKSQIDISEVDDAIERLIPDLTFQEAFELTGANINISVAPAELHQTSRLLNSITSPNVYIRTAVKASCAVPGVFPAVMLEAKNIKGEKQPYLPTRKWVDGSMTDDLPAKRLARLYGVNHYIGSLINPIVLFANEEAMQRGGVGDVARKVGHMSVSACARGMDSMAQRYGKNWPRVKLFTNMAHSVFHQNYHADIAVFPDFRNFKMSKILSQLSAEELMALVRQGERATWRKMDMIRTSSKISKVLDEILLRYNEKELHRLARRNKSLAAAG